MVLKGLGLLDIVRKCCCHKTWFASVIIALHDLILSCIGGILSLYLLDETLKGKTPSQLPFPVIWNDQKISVIVFTLTSLLCITNAFLDSLLLHGLRKGKPEFMLPWIYLRQVLLVLMYLGIMMALLVLVIKYELEVFNWYFMVPVFSAYGTWFLLQLPWLIVLCSYIDITQKGRIHREESKIYLVNVNEHECHI